MDLETRIALALASRAAEQAQHDADEKQKREQRIDEFYELLGATFGDLREELGALIIAPADSESRPSARIYFRGRAYSLRVARSIYSWALARLDERPIGDWRNLPRADVYANGHYSIEERQRNLLLALVDLDAEPELDPLPGTPIDEPPAEAEAQPPRSSRVEAAIVGALRDLIREEIAAAREE